MYMKKGIIVLAIILVIFMFSFLAKFFGSGGSSSSPAANTQSVGAVSDTVDVSISNLFLDLYSMDFSGADKIVVVRTDYSKDDKPQKQLTITDQNSIDRIVSLLSELPKNGDIMKKIAPGIEHTVIAYKNAEAFAYVTFFGSSLKTEDTSFYSGGNNAASEKETELYGIILH